MFCVILKLSVCCSGCESNQAVYQATQLEQRQSFNLDEITNITNVSEDYNQEHQIVYFALFNYFFLHSVRVIELQIQ